MKLSGYNVWMTITCTWIRFENIKKNKLLRLQLKVYLSLEIETKNCNFSKTTITN